MYFDQINIHKDEIINISRTLYSLAEPAFQEIETTKYILNFLSELGIEAVNLKTGCFGELNFNKERTIAIRADIDALPQPDSNGSCKHLCGHNIHTSSLLMAIKFISLGIIKPKANIRFIFQPAEEIVSGAKYIIENKGLDNVDSIYALHVEPEIELGSISIKKGAVMAGSVHFNIKLQGISCHAAYPHKGNDLIVAAANFINTAQTIISRKINPTFPALISFGSINAGHAANILPDKLLLRGTYRFLDKEVKKQISSGLKNLLQSIAEYNGILYQFEEHEGTIPVINDPSLVKKLESILISSKLNIVEDSRVSMGGEDFCHYIDKVKGAFIRLGIKSGIETIPLHNSSFNAAPEAAIYGTYMWLKILENLEE